MSIKVEKSLLRLASYIVIGGISIVFGMVIGGTVSGSAVTGVEGIPLAVSSAAAGSGASLAENPFVSVAGKLRQTVVQITTTKVVTQRYWNPFEGSSENPLEEFFPEFFGRQRERKNQSREYKRKLEGLGSGFIIDEKGYILTNYHVIKDVDEIQVKLCEEKEPYKAEIVGEPDVNTDIALIKIEPRHKLTVAKLGDSEKIMVGEWVMAIGNPFGLEETLTVGVISAKGRSGFLGMPRYQNFIQTDASINLGNSGGPLVNTNAEVIGMNTFIISPFVAHGLGFAIPINMVKEVYEEILKHGRVIRGYLGIIPQDVDPAMAKLWDLPSDMGVVVSDVEEDTPASRGGLQIQDVIVEFDGKKITGEEQFRKIVASTSVGKKVKVKVMRDGKEKVLAITIAELPSFAKMDKEGEKNQKLGLIVREITPAMSERYRLKEKKGVIVIDVEGVSPSDGKIEPGDIIKKINDCDINNMDDYISALEGVKEGEDVIFLIRRGKYTLFMVIKAE